MRIIELENALDALSVSKGTFTDSPTEYNGRVTKCEVTRKKKLFARAANVTSARGGTTMKLTQKTKV